MSLSAEPVAPPSPPPLHLVAVPHGAGIDADAAERAVADLLVALGEDPTEERLRDTPRRVADSFRELLSAPPFEHAFPYAPSPPNVEFTTNTG